MTFDLAQMIADREAGTPGDFSQTGLTVYALMPWGWKRGVAQFCNRFSAHIQGGYGATEAQCLFDDELLANARRIASVPLLEAEIIRLTARVAELEGALKPLADMAERYDPDEGDDGNLECWSGLAVPKIHHLRTARAALSTPTEEPK